MPGDPDPDQVYTLNKPNGYEEKGTMFRKYIYVVMVGLLLGAGSVVLGQNTGGDKNRRTTTMMTQDLNPQPLPPGKRHSYKKSHHHRKGHGTNSKTRAAKPNYTRYKKAHGISNDALTVKQK